MGLLQTLTDLFESIFKRSSPEVQKKQMLKKLDLEIREFTPSLCKGGLLQGNFGEAVFTLYKNLKPLDNLFSKTVSANDLPRQHRFEAQLIMTGYSSEDQEIVESLSFENRKQAVLEDYDNSDKIYLHQRKQLEKVVKALNTEGFKKMDQDILNLRQLVELSRYNFVPFLQIFDNEFVPSDFSYTPTYREVEVAKAYNLLEDLYYQTAGLKITNVIANEVLALAQLRKGSELDSTEKNNYIGNLKKINFILNRILTTEKLKKIIQYGKQDAAYEPAVAKYNGSPRMEFASMLQSRYESDENRIKQEIQDEKLSEEISTLFPGIPLFELESYNQKVNENLQSNTAFSFKWIMPLRILKTFLTLFITDGIKSLLNDIVIEGFFNNQNYKTSFSTVVYSVINAEADFQAFEDSFGQSERNSIAVLESYIKDSKKDKDFYKKLEEMVAKINNEAHELLQNQVTNLFSLYNELGELLADAKKPSSEIISNLKVLVMSSRNRDNTNFLETQYPSWKVFFEIMKNYVIINSGEIQL